MVDTNAADQYLENRNGIWKRISRWINVVHPVLELSFAGMIVWLALITLQIDKQGNKRAQLADAREKRAEKREEVAFQREQLADQRDKEKSLQESIIRFRTHLEKAEQQFCQSHGFDRSLGISMQFSYAARLEPELEEHLHTSDYVVLSALGSYFWPLDEARVFGETATKRAKVPLDCYVAELVLGHVCFKQFRDSGNEAHLAQARESFSKAVACLCGTHSPPKCDYFEGKAEMDWAANELACGFDDQAQIHFAKAQQKWSNLPDGDSRIKEIDNIIKDYTTGITTKVPCPSQLYIEPDLIASIPADKRTFVFKPIDGELKEPAPELDEPVDIIPEEPTIEDLRLRLQKLIKLNEEFREKYESSIQELRQSVNGTNASPITDPQQDPAPQDQSQDAPRCSILVINRTPERQYPRINGHEFMVKPNDNITVPIVYGKFTTKRARNARERLWGSSFLLKQGSRHGRAFEITDCCFHPLPRKWHRDGAL